MLQQHGYQTRSSYVRSIHVKCEQGEYAIFQTYTDGMEFYSRQHLMDEYSSVSVAEGTVALCTQSSAASSKKT